MGIFDSLVTVAAAAGMSWLLLLITKSCRERTYPLPPGALCLWAGWDIQMIINGAGEWGPEFYLQPAFLLLESALFWQFFKYRHEARGSADALKSRQGCEMSDFAHSIVKPTRLRDLRSRQHESGADGSEAWEQANFSEATAGNRKPTIIWATTGSGALVMIAASAGSIWWLNRTLGDQMGVTSVLLVNAATSAIMLTRLYRRGTTDGQSLPGAWLFLLSSMLVTTAAIIDPPSPASMDSIYFNTLSGMIPVVLIAAYARKYRNLERTSTFHRDRH
ncbi:hypothetical protein LKL35_37365 [Streptomyces sp. ET3-23]|uniref:hypothetical protein n=1 Tax=Streptomyces sp. ET3-23 TaxID=2885643 RepID=UPI001D12905D|nr:hypothetical protein [Streptomyces sp. ET3-23]MCC2280979.1 hypothetical protein [Streptomyces sp. ET3-23]